MAFTHHALQADGIDNVPIGMRFYNDLELPRHSVSEVWHTRTSPPPKLNVRRPSNRRTANAR